MIDAQQYRTTVTHTETSENGSVVVITDVPAYVYEEGGEQDTVYDMDVALAIDEFVAKCFASSAAARRVFTYTYSDIRKGVKPHLELRVTGKNISLGSTSTKVWHELLEKINSGYSYLRTVYAKSFSVPDIDFLDVSRVGEGSLVLELRARDKREPIPGFDIEAPLSPEVQIMQLLIDGYAYATGENVENPLINGHPAIAFAAVKAVEKLAPSGKSDINTITLTPKDEVLARSNPVTLTRSTHSKAREKKRHLSSPDDADRRSVRIIGKVARLETDGTFTIRDIELNEPGEKRHPTRAIFHEGLRASLAKFWTDKARVEFRGIEFLLNDDWSNIPIIRYAELAPAVEEVGFNPLFPPDYD